MVAPSRDLSSQTADEPPRRHPRARGGYSRGRHHSPHRVRDLVRSAVLEGWYSSEDQLIEDVLIHTHAASRNAVRNALQQLLTEGIVTRSPRRGTFPSWDGTRIHLVDIHSLDRDAERGGRVITRGLVPATPFLQGRLGTEDASLRIVESVFELRGEPIGIRTAYFSSRFDIEAATDSAPRPNTLAGVIAGIFSCELGYVTTEISAGLVDDRTAQVLKMERGSPVLRREQLVRDDVGQPVEILFDCFRADRATFMLSDFGSPGAWPGHLDDVVPASGRDEGSVP